MVQVKVGSLVELTEAALNSGDVGVVLKLLDDGSVGGKAFCSIETFVPHCAERVLSFYANVFNLMTEKIECWWMDESYVKVLE